MEGVCSCISQITVNNSASDVEDVNSYSSQQQTLGVLEGQTACELEIIYFNARSILLKLDELGLLNLQKQSYVSKVFGYYNYVTISWL